MKQSIWITLGVLLLVCLTGRAADYVVNVYSDYGDMNPGDGICQCDSFYNCSLKAAIEESNLDGESSRITFSQRFTGGERIPADTLPALTEDYTVIDGSGQWNGTFPGGQPGVELFSSNNLFGMLYITGHGCQISGLALIGANSRGIRVVGCINTLIGGPDPGQRNALVCGYDGVTIDIHSQYSLIMNNFIGTLDGQYLYAATTGVSGIHDSGASSYIHSNLVAGYQNGMLLIGTKAQVISNTVGSTFFHDGPLPNGYGLQISNGAELIESNFIAGNTNAGILCIHDSNTLIQYNTFGIDDLKPRNGGHGIHIEVGSNLTIHQNSLMWNKQCGIYARGNDNLITGNWIIRNDTNGIELCGTGNRIGHADSTVCNTITQNGAYGIRLFTISGFATTGNMIYNNNIGLMDDGISDGGNLIHGILVDAGCQSNFIGGMGDREGNWIAWNQGSGIILAGNGVTGNVVTGNWIGLPRTLSFATPNGNHGIGLYDGAESNIIGSIIGNRNIICGNNWTGVAVVGSNNNTVAGNSIGTSDFLTEGNRNYGIHIFNSSGTQVLLNHIAHNGTDNGQAGIRIEGVSSVFNLMSQNSIHDHSDPGIELADGGNQMLAAPAITYASSAHIEGTTCGSCIVEIFSDSGNEGRQYEGSAQSNPAGNFSYDGSLSGPYITATTTDAQSNTSTFSAPYEILTLGLMLEMPSNYFRLGDPCYLRARLRNDQTRSGVPVFVILDISGAYWFWPGWTKQTDYEKRDIPAGATDIDIISQFNWPDIGTQTMSGIVFWGAMLNNAMTEVLGGNSAIGQWTFGFGP